tara:strand:- start:1782 stop:2636 length:855 start_codon:yes stop_codon:yes gene_type:complete
MEVEITVEQLQERKIMVATPMYGGMCGGQYTKSSVDLGQQAAKYGIDVGFFYIFNESLITRARNYLVDEFMRSHYTHLMFIDADIGFDASDVLALAALADPDSDKDIVAAPYPKKTISWEKIKRAVDKGVADDNANNLENYVGDFVFNPAPGTEQIKINEPAEVLEAGTGFMMIQKHVFEKFGEAHPELLYTPDHIRTANFDGTRKIHAFFDTVIDPKSNRYLSEDYMFCQWARELGIKVWMCPWMRLKHMGSYIFGGDLASLASIGASATADVSQLGKEKPLE